ncbi:hypothetical protein EJV47_04895 [Hymenobacter gummosus]|uniref:Uncharacterized protein n=1 Tax=Hymenobacter gummosus TaxID=1776032 RepID=A0A3S0H955_9BACT|nr:hypothetical protein [Hymenobacter gummosus]RTQ52355.1 hypothetical protein EJV47_04895 [Hymenobacter gummosus]
MRSVTFTVANDHDYQLLLAQRLGLSVRETGAAPAAAPEAGQLSRAELLAAIDRGGDGLSIPDPLAWQQGQRTDRPLPFRP